MTTCKLCFRKCTAKDFQFVETCAEMQTAEGNRNPLEGLCGRDHMPLSQPLAITGQGIQIMATSGSQKTTKSLSWKSSGAWLCHYMALYHSSMRGRLVGCQHKYRLIPVERTVYGIWISEYKQMVHSGWKVCTYGYIYIQRKFRSSNFRLYWKLPVALAASMFDSRDVVQRRCETGEILAGRHCAKCGVFP